MRRLSPVLLAFVLACGGGGGAGEGTDDGRAETRAVDSLTDASLGETVDIRKPPDLPDLPKGETTPEEVSPPDLVGDLPDLQDLQPDLPTDVPSDMTQSEVLLDSTAEAEAVDTVQQTDAGDVNEELVSDTATDLPVDLEPCVPDCSAAECGDDGCGGSCGDCPDGTLCEESLCQALLCAPDDSPCTDTGGCGNICLQGICGGVGVCDSSLAMFVGFSCVCAPATCNDLTAALWRFEDPEDPQTDLVEELETEIVGAAVVTPAPAMQGFGKALEFTGEDAQMVVPLYFFGYEAQGTWAVDFWFQWKSGGNLVRFLGLDEPVEIGIHPDGYMLLSIGGQAVVSPQLFFGPGEWHHLACVAEGGQWRFYFDGQAWPEEVPMGESFEPLVMELATASFALDFGTWKGLVDELRLSPDPDQVYTCLFKAAGSCTLDAQCADDDPCTQDLCDPHGRCSHPPDNGASCEDVFACTLGDVCQNFMCTPGDQVLPCEDGNPCTLDDDCSSGVCLPGEWAPAATQTYLFDQPLGADGQLGTEGSWLDQDVSLGPSDLLRYQAAGTTEELLAWVEHEKGRLRVLYGGGEPDMARAFFFGTQPLGQVYKTEVRLLGDGCEEGGQLLGAMAAVQLVVRPGGGAPDKDSFAVRLLVWVCQDLGYGIVVPLGADQRLRWTEQGWVQEAAPETGWAWGGATGALPFMDSEDPETWPLVRIERDFSAWTVQVSRGDQILAQTDPLPLAGLPFQWEPDYLLLGHAAESWLDGQLYVDRVELSAPGACLCPFCSD